MVTKVIAIAVVALVVGRFFVRRDSEIARRFRIFIDVLLVVMAVVYGGRLLSLWLN
jgi:hypothetical protein